MPPDRLGVRRRRVDPCILTRRLFFYFCMLFSIKHAAGLALLTWKMSLEQLMLLLQCLVKSQHLRKSDWQGVELHIGIPGRLDCAGWVTYSLQCRRNSADERRSQSKLWRVLLQKAQLAFARPRHCLLVGTRTHVCMPVPYVT